MHEFVSTRALFSLRLEVCILTDFFDQKKGLTVRAVSLEVIASSQFIRTNNTYASFVLKEMFCFEILKATFFSLALFLSTGKSYNLEQYNCRGVGAAKPLTI